MSEHERSGETTASGDWARLANVAAETFDTLGYDDEVDLVRELLVFGLDGSDYAIPVERVREIVRMRELTRVPRTPEWLLGVLALRGEIVEVLDLRRRLGLAVGERSRSNRIIVLHGDADRVTGILVDSVAEVWRCREDEIIPAQEGEVGAVVEMSRGSEGFVSILDVDRVLEVSDG